MVFTREKNGTSNQNREPFLYTTSVLEINFWAWSSAGSLGLNLLVHQQNY